MNLTNDIENLWSELSVHLSFDDNMSLEALKEFRGWVYSVLESLSSIEETNGELLSRAAYWPKDKILHGSEIYALGLQVANMAGLRGFLERLGNDELSFRIHLAGKSSPRREVSS